MSNHPHACEIPILVQSEFWVEDPDRALAAVMWVKHKIAKDNLSPRNVAIGLLQASATERTTHMSITMQGSLIPIWAEYDTGKVLCTSCAGKGTIPWAHKPPEPCKACGETGYTGENIYEQMESGA